MKPKGSLGSYLRYWAMGLEEEVMVREQGDRETQRERREEVPDGMKPLGPRILCDLPISQFVADR